MGTSKGQRYKPPCIVITTHVTIVTVHTQGRPSSDPEDPELKELEEKAMLVGRAPRRVSMTNEEMMELQIKAAGIVKKGEVGSCGLLCAITSYRSQYC